MRQDHQTAPPQPRRKKTRHPRLQTGERVRFAEGTLSGTGTVDAVTSDYAIVWVWADEGQGRRMLMQGYGSIVSLEPADEDAFDGGA